MPPAPELLDGPGAVGVVEVFLEVKAKDPAQADGHVAVAAEVKVDLEGVGHCPQPGQPDIQAPRLQAKHGVGDAGGGVGQQQLFAQAQDEPPHPPGGVGEGGPPGMDFGGDVPVFDDGPRHQLGEQADVQQHLKEAAVLEGMVPVDVDDVGQPLEGEKGDAHRQHNGGHRQGRAQQQIEVLHQEAQVFIKGQGPQVHRHRQSQEQPAPPGVGHQQPCQIIAQHRPHQQQQVKGVAERVKNQAGHHQQGVFAPDARHQPVQDADNRQEDAEKYNGTECHRSAFLPSCHWGNV